MILRRYAQAILPLFLALSITKIKKKENKYMVDLLRNTKTGDTLVDNNSWLPRLDGIVTPPPVFVCAVEPGTVSGYAFPLLSYVILNLVKIRRAERCHANLAEGGSLIPLRAR